MDNNELRELLEKAREEHLKGNKYPFDSIFNYCYKHYKSRCNNNTDFKAAFVDAMFKVWEKFILKQDFLPEQPANYTRSMIENTWKNHQTKGGKNKYIKMEDEIVEYLNAQEHQHEEYNPLIIQENDITETIEQKKQIWTLAITFLKLSEVCQKILIARHYEGRKLKDIFDMFDFKNYDTLKSKASQCKKRWEKLANKSLDD